MLPLWSALPVPCRHWLGRPSRDRVSFAADIAEKDTRS
jgi:hypothetical protein